MLPKPTFATAFFEMCTIIGNDTYLQCLCLIDGLVCNLPEETPDIL